MKVFSFTCELPNGVHARPASHVEKLCNRFCSDIEWKNERTGIAGNAKSVLSLIGTDTLLGDTCSIRINGADEEQAFDELNKFITDEFPKCDEPLSSTDIADAEFTPLPRSFSNLNPQIIRGHAVCSGFGQGNLVRIGSIDFDSLEELTKCYTESEGQFSLLQEGIDKLSNILEDRKTTATQTEAEVVSAHLSIVGDEEFKNKLKQYLEMGLSCAQSIVVTGKNYAKQMKNSSSAYMRERELDIRDVCFQLLQAIYGEEHFSSQLDLNGPTVCIAEDLTPSQFLKLDKRLLRGLLLTHGGNTSHTVILARSFAIPTLVGIDESQINSFINKEVIADGSLGLIVTDITPPIKRYYEQQQRVSDAVKERQELFRDKQGMTADSSKLEVAANIAHSVEANPAFNNGAESIGLFRTEMLYMDRPSAPSEDELYGIFCVAAEAANGKAIIIRTIDIGGDKPVDYLNLPAENNPFLGYRAVRIYEQFLDMFKTQLKAILRASAKGRLKIMIPMISSLEEILWVKEIIEEVRLELLSKKIPFDNDIPLGIMVEVPSVAFIIDQFCQEVDFFSIGSNDLTQYLMAVDRDNANVTKHYNSLNPAFLRALNHIAVEVHRHGKWVGLCGELGANSAVLPLLVGLGLDEISMSAPSIPATKEYLSKLDSRECRQLLEDAMQCRTALEVQDLLTRFQNTQYDAPIITSECITLDNDLRTKEEVIKSLSDNLFLAGRCKHPEKLADDLWAREDVFSTGLGFGFAIPHTKSDHIEQSTISVSRLKNPIKWGDDDANMVIMLTLNKQAAGDQHMKIFSKLARKIMHAEFRDSLINSSSPEELETKLQAELEL